MNVIRQEAIAAFDMDVKQKWVTSLYSQTVDECDSMCAIACFTDNYGVSNSWIVNECVIPNCGRSCASSQLPVQESLISLNAVDLTNAEDQLINSHNRRLIKEASFNRQQSLSCDLECSNECLYAPVSFEVKEACLQSQCDCRINLFYKAKSCDYACGNNCMNLPVDHSRRIKKCFNQCGCDRSQIEHAEDVPTPVTEDEIETPVEAETETHIDIETTIPFENELVTPTEVEPETIYDNEPVTTSDNETETSTDDETETTTEDETETTAEAEIESTAEAEAETTTEVETTTETETTTESEAETTTEAENETTTEAEAETTTEPETETSTETESETTTPSDEEPVIEAEAAQILISTSTVDVVLSTQSQETNTNVMIAMAALLSVALIASLLTLRKAKKITSKQHIMRRRDLRKERSEKMIDQEQIVFDERGTFIIDSSYEKIV